MIHTTAVTAWLTAQRCSPIKSIIEHRQAQTSSSCIYSAFLFNRCPKKKKEDCRGGAKKRFFHLLVVEIQSLFFISSCNTTEMIFAPAENEQGYSECLRPVPFLDGYSSPSESDFFSSGNLVSLFFRQDRGSHLCRPLPLMWPVYACV